MVDGDAVKTANQSTFPHFSPEILGAIVGVRQNEKAGGGTEGARLLLPLPVHYSKLLS